MNDRLAKLAALTRGAAVITISASAAGAMAGGCTKNDASSPPPAAGSSSGAPAPSEVGDAEVDASGPVALHRRFPIPNAIRPAWRRRDGGSDSPDGGGGDGP